MSESPEETQIDSPHLDGVVELCRQLIAAPSEHPPGDTRAAAQVVMSFLDTQNLPYRVVSRDERMPNIVSVVEGAEAGRHLVLNGHLDTFPAGSTGRWDFDPFGGELHDGRIYGRGAADMKGGLSSLIVAFAAAARSGIDRGKLTLTVVSDEEVFGPNGARHLLDHPDGGFVGDALLSAEPSSPWLIRCGEKGFAWAKISVLGHGGHGAMAIGERNAIHTLLGILMELTSRSWEVSVPVEAMTVIESARESTDRAWGEGASEQLTTVSTSVGRIGGGTKLNVAAGEAWAEIDIRLPPGLAVSVVRHQVDELLARHTSRARIEWLNQSEPSINPPSASPLFAAVRDATTEIYQEPAVYCLGPPATDSRLWRQAGVPAAVYGPQPKNVGAPNEHVLVDELAAVNQIHLGAISRFLGEA